MTYVSALTGMGMDSLADTIVALEEVSDLRADLSGRAEGMIIETSTNVGQG